MAEEVGDTQGVVAHQVGVGGGRQAGGEDNQEEGKPGKAEVEEGEGEEVEAVVGVLGLEGVSRPCHRRRSPCPLQKSMEKAVEGCKGGSQKASACSLGFSSSSHFLP